MSCSALLQADQILAADTDLIKDALNNSLPIANFNSIHVVTSSCHDPV